jgi:L-asparaginase
MLILNSGGTFNKRYNPLNGQVEVPYDNSAPKEILVHTSGLYEVAGVLYKDSLDMSVNDRKILARVIAESDKKRFIIIHGTDTMSQSAEFLHEIFDDRIIVFVGAMRPFEIDKLEASFNLGMAIGFAKATTKEGVYICMDGYADEWQKLEKNRKFGKFELAN